MSKPWWGGIILSVTIWVASASASGVYTKGDLKITGNGSGVVFADGTVQTTAASPASPTTLSIGTVSTGAPGSSASATITGTPPSQTLNLVIPQGAPGPAGASVDCTLLWGHMTNIVNYPAIGNTPAYSGVGEVRNIFDTTGKGTGWVQVFVTGSPTSGPSNVSSNAAYLTAYNDHNDPSEGTVVATPNYTYRITMSYTYDSDGHRTQRVRNWYNPDGSLYRVQTTNYGPNFSYISETSNVNGAITTTTYSGTLFDSRNYPYLSNFTVTNPAGVVTSTGTTLYEFSSICFPTPGAAF